MSRHDNVTWINALYCCVVLKLDYGDRGRGKAPSYDFGHISGVHCVHFTAPKKICPKRHYSNSYNFSEAHTHRNRNWQPQFVLFITYYLRFDVFTAITMKNAVLCDVALCSSQNLIFFIRGKAMSGAPSVKGTNQFPKIYMALHPRRPKWWPSRGESHRQCTTDEKRIRNFDRKPWTEEIIWEI
jgi:hypothetical protein